MRSTGRPANAYGNQTYAGNGAGYAGLRPEPAAGGDRPAGPRRAPATRMTIDSVVQKTGISLAVVIVTAAVTWCMTGDISTERGDIGALYLALMTSARSAPSGCRWSTRSSG